MLLNKKRFVFTLQIVTLLVKTCRFTEKISRKAVIDCSTVEIDAYQGYGKGERKQYISTMIV